MDRNFYTKEIDSLFKTHRIVGILGPRQCGKTTLVKEYLRDTISNFDLSANYFDLEDPNDLERLQNPRFMLEQLKGLIIIDEIQRIPDLFPVLRVIHDLGDERRFIILGSASRELLRQSSESLAGRIAYMEMTPFSSFEGCDLNSVWARGGFPRSYLAETDLDSYNWRKHYVRTFLEQDIPNLGFSIPAVHLRRYWAMLANYHGQIFNASAMATSLEMSSHTMKRYLDLLHDTLMIRVLSPWHENIRKRQVKSPKVYFRDSGIFHYFMGIQDRNSLLNTPKLGASWEGFALEEIIRYHRADSQDCWFWSSHSGEELDLIIMKDNKRLGFEFKFSDKPSHGKPTLVARDLLKLDECYIIHPGHKSWINDQGFHIRALSDYR